MKSAVIVQMRLDSSRLFRKAMLPVGDACLATLVLRRLKRIPADFYVLACDEASMSSFEPLASAAGFAVHAGPKEDVLARFIQVIEKYNIDRVIRATGDNPFVSAELAVLLMDHASASGSDYAGYLAMPSGMGVEVVRSASLLRAGSETSDPENREHVCPYLYRNPSLFKIERPECPAPWRFPQGRVSIDTHADYERLLTIVAALGQDPADMAVMQWLKRESSQAEYA